MPELSPSVAAAVARNPKLARVVRAIGQTHNPFEAPPLGGPALVELPPDLSHNELGVTPEDLQPKAEPDAIDVALHRIDALDDRQRRYRHATGRQRRLMEPGKPMTLKIEPSLLRQVDEMASQRGSSRSEAFRWLIGCGLILADERRRRYEAFMVRQMEEVRAQGRAIDAAPYVDPQSSSLPAATQEAMDPLYGVPEYLRDIVRGGEVRPSIAKVDIPIPPSAQPQRVFII